MVAVDEPLADRIRHQLAGRGELTENRVFDGVGFFIEDRLAVAVLGDTICIHLAGSQPASPGGETPEPFIFAGRPVPGWVSIPAHGLDDETLAHWLGRGLANLSSTV